MRFHSSGTSYGKKRVHKTRGHLFPQLWICLQSPNLIYFTSISSNDFQSPHRTVRSPLHFVQETCRLSFMIYKDFFGTFPDEEVTLRWVTVSDNTNKLWIALISPTFAPKNSVRMVLVTCLNEVSDLKACSQVRNKQKSRNAAPINRKIVFETNMNPTITDTRKNFSCYFLPPSPSFECSPAI